MIYYFEAIPILQYTIICSLLKVLFIKKGWLTHLFKQRGDLNVLYCAALAFDWSFPPLVGLESHFVCEEIEFYCKSFSSITNISHLINLL